MLAGIGCLLAGALAYKPLVEASSHRDSPFISEDPAADNTDVYAFVSYETGREDYVTLLSNFVPLQEPANGPNFYRLSDFVNYEIHVDVDGDAHEDLTYQFKFITQNRRSGHVFVRHEHDPPSAESGRSDFAVHQSESAAELHIDRAGPGNIAGRPGLARERPHRAVPSRAEDDQPHLGTVGEGRIRRARRHERRVPGPRTDGSAYGAEFRWGACVRRPAR